MLTSPFLSLKDVLVFTVKKRFLLKYFDDFLIKKLGQNIEKNYKLKFEDMQSFDEERKIGKIQNYCPFVIIASKGDWLIPHRFSEELYGLLQGDKKLFEFEGEHHANVPYEIFDESLNFILKNKKAR